MSVKKTTNAAAHPAISQQERGFCHIAGQAVRTSIATITKVATAGRHCSS